MLRDLIITRLKDQVISLRKIGKAADLASAMQDGSNQFPRAYVLPNAEQGGQPRLMTGAVAQRRTPRIGIVLVVKNVRDMVGDAAGSDMEALRLLTDEALFGWKPDDAHSALMFAGGRLLNISNGEVWWQDDYTTDYDRRKNVQ